VENFFALDHADFALEGPRGFHASDPVSLPDYLSFHDVFDFLLYFVTVFTVSAVLGEMFGESIGS